MKTNTRKFSFVETTVEDILFVTASIFVRFLGSTYTISIEFWRVIVVCFTLLIVVIVFRKSFHRARASVVLLGVLSVGKRKS